MFLKASIKLRLLRAFLGFALAQLVCMGIGVYYYSWVLAKEVNQPEVVAMIRQFRWTLIGMGLLLMIVFVPVILWVSQRIANPITALSEATAQAASGNLTVDVPQNQIGEIGSLAGSFSAMITGFSMLISQLYHTTSQIQRAGDDIRESTHRQANGISEQAEAVSLTTSAAMELSKTSEQIGESIKRVSDMSEHVLEGMQALKDTTLDVNAVIQCLRNKSRDISNITQLINEIADKTNLLAVNAAIEAARAGEQGRGFSVVADQIGKLADSTAHSTKDIATLIEAIELDMNRIVTAMDHSMGNVDEEVQLAEDAALKASEIATTASEQVLASRHIADAMQNINSSMRIIKEGAEKSLHTTQELTQLSEEVKESVQGFEVS